MQDPRGDPGDDGGRDPVAATVKTFLQACLEACFGLPRPPERGGATREDLHHDDPTGNGIFRQCVNEGAKRTCRLLAPAESRNASVGDPLAGSEDENFLHFEKALVGPTEKRIEGPGRHMGHGGQLPDGDRFIAATPDQLDHRLFDACSLIGGNLLPRLSRAGPEGPEVVLSGGDGVRRVQGL